MSMTLDFFGEKVTFSVNPEGNVSVWNDKPVFLRVPRPPFCLSGHCVYNPKSLCVGSNLGDKHHQISPQCSHPSPDALCSC